jgi:hypothetical protein
VTSARTTHESPRKRVLLLSGQAFALGLTTAWITIPASAIFLEVYGSELLPVTYIGAAVAGVVSSTLLAAAFRRSAIASVATRVLAGLSVVLVASWAVLSMADADWVSFALLVLIPILVPVGFIFVVGQAGLLLDVRSLKALYGRVVAGFALGFTAGGLGGPPLLALLGTTESLLAAAATAAALFLALVVATRRSYATELSVVEHAEVTVGTGEAERPTVRALSRNRYVVLIVAFQMLSAVESQWLDFLVLESAAQRYTETDELARFMSQFSAIAYGTDIIFLLVLAGWLLRRFGLRYGLTANPIGVLTLLAAIIVGISVVGSSATIVFVLIVAARVTDLTLADGAVRTSLSAAYQAVPNRLRAVAQATVEGLGVPVAIGVSGIVLLVVQAAGGTDGLVMPVITGLVVMAWVVVAILVYREYRVNLLGNLRGRTLDLAALTIEDDSSLVVIERLVESEEERDVRLGLDILTIAEHPELETRLQRLVADDRVSVRTDALERLVRVAPQAAVTAARQGLDDPSSDVRAASIRVLGATSHPSDLEGVAAHSNDSALVVKAAVAFALTRMGDDAVRAQVATEISGLARSDTASNRAIAALMLGEVAPGDWIDRTTVLTLLADPDAHVVEAALGALRCPEDSGTLAAVVRHLGHRETAGAAIDALVRGGDAALTVIDEGLCGDAHPRHVQELLVRAAREIGGASAIAMLHRHIEHRDRDVGLAVMRALAVLGPSGADDEYALTASVVRGDLEHAAHALRAVVAFGDVPSATLLRAALRDELDLARERVLAAFSMRHGTEGFSRVVFQLAQRDARSHALALEWLDVTLTGTDRTVIALLEPRLSDRERLNTLVSGIPVPPLRQREVLLDLVHDRGNRWRRPWVKACALYTAWGMSEVEFEAVAGTAAEPEAIGADQITDDEESIVHETLDGLRRRRRDPV